MNQLEKDELRQQGIAILQKLAENTKKKKQKEATILTLFFASQLWKNAKSIGVVRSTEFEFDTQPIIARGLAEGKIVTVPKSLPGHQLAFYEVDEYTAYRKTTFGVEEPVSNLFVTKEEIDLLLVPGIVFSSQGYRIGFGGGFYDRYLADFEGNTCSLVFSEQLNDDWEPFTFDRPIARIYTDYAKGRKTHEPND
ncbi:5-formyltetrahydrofolate cyclo-ligase [Enterococcus saccharolyticus]|uniref:5-formyltetrahydrofolate cyclo-ligase n=1 Tax=Enterococcus saccharolyticus TaxID=41997 RepID=UPI001E5CAB22|nr:5-formyltetrahydrofolate cyclo-ligase [Enterococcus saccharolyticus]MCD5001093.1 5-formyltetrahydrofolate cyclo-ligase [Enterococcus saccharolyticus]